MKNLTVALVGASGYTGMECIRYLLHHPQFKLTQLYGHNSAGLKISDVYPAFKGVFDEEIGPLSHISQINTDAILIALPHGHSADMVHELSGMGYKGLIVDLGSDFRLHKASDYERYYGWKHPHPEMLGSMVYGLSESNKDLISKSRHVANPGCFATAIQLGLLPLLKSGITGPFHITGLTGSSGSGANPSQGTHFTSRDANLKPYKALEHQHLGEIHQHIEDLQLQHEPIHFVPVSAPMTRGIWITISGVINMDVNLESIFHTEYKDRRLIRLREGLPELKPTCGTAFADIGWVSDQNAFVVGVSIDNLGKGAAGQAIQNLNIMVGIPEHTGLLSVGNVL